MARTTTVTNVQLAENGSVAAITVTTTTDDDDFGPYGLGDDDDDDGDDNPKPVDSEPPNACLKRSEIGFSNN